MSANGKNRRACGDYGALHRSLEAVGSKKIGYCSNTADYCGKSVRQGCLLFTALFTVSQ
jgi:hypothetical protein